MCPWCFRLHKSACPTCFAAALAQDWCWILCHFSCRHKNLFTSILYILLTKHVTKNIHWQPFFLWLKQDDQDQRQYICGLINMTNIIIFTGKCHLNKIHFCSGSDIAVNHLSRKTVQIRLCSQIFKGGVKHSVSVNLMLILST